MQKWKIFNGNFRSLNTNNQKENGLRKWILITHEKASIIAIDHKGMIGFGHKKWKTKMQYEKQYMTNQIKL